PVCGTEARSDSAEQVADALVRDHPSARALICFPLPAQAMRDPATLVAGLLQRGFARLKIGATVLDLADQAGQPGPGTAPGAGGGGGVVVDGVGMGGDGGRRLTDSLETALAEGQGSAVVEIVGGPSVSVSRELRCPACEVALVRPRPLLFTFNHPLGACAECK